MAYITKAEVQTKQKQLALLNKQYRVTARFSGSNSSSLVLTVSSASIDFIENYKQVVKEKPMFSGEVDEYLDSRKHISVNHYYLNTQFNNIALEYLQKAYSIMIDGYYDESDVMTDYFCCSWYNTIQIGRWNKPFQYKE